MICTLVGCGQGKGDITGKVTHKSKALAGATITFYDEFEGPPVSSTIKEDGSYEAKSITAGTAKIAIVQPLAISMPGVAAPKTTPINPKYADREKSGLTLKVARGSQTHNIDLPD